MNYQINPNIDVKKQGDEYAIELLAATFDPVVANLIIQVLQAEGYRVEVATNLTTLTPVGIRLFTKLERGRSIATVVEEVKQILGEQVDTTKQVNVTQIGPTGLPVQQNLAAVTVPTVLGPLGGLLGKIPNFNNWIKSGALFDDVFIKVSDQIFAAPPLEEEILKGGLNRYAIASFVEDLGFVNLSTGTPAEMLVAANKFFTEEKRTVDVFRRNGRERYAKILEMFERQVRIYIIENADLPDLVAKIATPALNLRLMKPEYLQTYFTDLGININNPAERKYLAEVTRELLIDPAIVPPQRDILRFLALPIGSSIIERGQLPNFEIAGILRRLQTDPLAADDLSAILHIDKTNLDFINIYSTIRIIGRFGLSDNELMQIVFNNQMRPNNFPELKDNVRNFLKFKVNEVLRTRALDQKNSMAYGEVFTLLNYLFAVPTDPLELREFLFVYDKDVIASPDMSTEQDFLTTLLQIINQTPPRLNVLKRPEYEAYKSVLIKNILVGPGGLNVPPIVPIAARGILKKTPLIQAVPNDNIFGPTEPMQVKIDSGSGDAHVPNLVNYYLTNNPEFIRIFGDLNINIGGLIGALRNSTVYPVLVNILNTSTDIDSIAINLKNVLNTANPPLSIYIQKSADFFKARMPAGVLPVERDDAARNLAINFIFDILILRTREEDLAARVNYPVLVFGNRGVLQMSDESQEIIRQNINTDGTINKHGIIENPENLRILAIEGYKLDIKKKVLMQIKANPGALSAADLERILNEVDEDYHKKQDDGAFYELTKQWANSREREEFTDELEVIVTTLLSNPLTFATEWKKEYNEVEKTSQEIYIIIGKRPRLGKPGETEEVVVSRATAENIKDLTGSLDTFVKRYRDKILKQEVLISDAEAKNNLKSYLGFIRNAYNIIPPAQVAQDQLTRLLNNRGIGLDAAEIGFLLIVVNHDPVALIADLTAGALAPHTIDEFQALGKKIMAQEMVYSVLKYEKYLENRNKAGKLQASLPTLPPTPPPPTPNINKNLNIGGVNVQVQNQVGFGQRVKNFFTKNRTQAAGHGAMIGAAAGGAGILFGPVGAAVVGAGFGAMDLLPQVADARDRQTLADVEKQRAALFADMETLPNIVKTHTEKLTKAMDAREFAEAKQEQLNELNKVYAELRPKIQQRVAGNERLKNRFTMAQYSYSEAAIIKTMEELNRIVEVSGNMNTTKVVALLNDLMAAMALGLQNMINELEAAANATKVKLSDKQRKKLVQLQQQAAA
jgi:hypothetical protein